MYLLGAAKDTVEYRLYPNLNVIYKDSDVLKITKREIDMLCLFDCMQLAEDGCMSAVFKEPNCTLLKQRKENLDYKLDSASAYSYYELTFPGNDVLIVGPNVGM